MSTVDRKGHHGPGSDEHRLHELGYAQELRRKMSGFSNFAVSFTIISVLSGCLTLYGFGMDAGGPVTFSISWPVVGVMVTFVALAMAEVCSSYPTAGGLYYWSAKLAKKNALAIGAGHSFLLFLGEGFYPINILNTIKNVPEVARIFCATANPVEVLVVQTEQGRGILGVVDGFSPKGVEDEEGITWRKDFLRMIGYKTK